jgi:glutamyl/glutaminyl-tRNA synthetase
LPTGVETARLAQFAQAIRHNVEFPTDAKLWVDVVFGSLGELEADALTRVREAGAEFFATASQLFAAGDKEFRQIVRELSERTGRKGPALYMPLRAALTSVLHGPELGPLLALIGVQEITARLEKARRLAG